VNATENLPAEQSQTSENARFSGTHENERRATGAESKTRQGAEASIS